MDCTDRKIIRILQQDARLTLKQIGKEVGLTPPAVAERIRRLESDSIILGYHARIDPLKLSKNLSAFIGVDVHPERYKQFIGFCEKNNCIIEHHRVVGVYSAILYVALHDTAQLEILLDEIKRYGTTSTSIILSTLFSNKPF